MQSSDKTLISELRRDEGVKNMPYKCTAGFNTVGVGHNLDANPLQYDWTYPLTNMQIDQLLAEDVQGFFEELDKRLDWWRGLSYARQRVIVNMAFNLGVDGLLGFKNTLAFIRGGDYQAAAKGMLSSKWAKQVGQRANRLAAMMVTG